MNNVISMKNTQNIIVFQYVFRLFGWKMSSYVSEKYIEKYIIMNSFDLYHIVIECILYHSMFKGSISWMKCEDNTYLGDYKTSSHFSQLNDNDK